MTAKPKVRIGVVGAGGISQVAHIPNLLTQDGVEVPALCDLDANRASMVAKRYNITRWYDEPTRMLEREKLDGVVIATPTITHLPLCRMALETGLDVMVEKPFARTPAEGKRIVEVAEKHNRILMTGMNHRYRDDTTELKRLIIRGELGEIVTVRCGWLKRLGVWGRPYWFADPKLSGGGVLMDLGLQMLDLILFLLEFPPILEVNGSVSNQILELQVEDTAAAYVKAGTTPVLLEVTWAYCSHEDTAYTTFTGSKALARLNPLRVVRRQKDRVGQPRQYNLGDEITLYRRSFQTEIAHFIECVRSRTTPLSTGRDAVLVLDVLERIYKSSEN